MRNTIMRFIIIIATMAFTLIGVPNSVQQVSAKATNPTLNHTTLNLELGCEKVKLKVKGAKATKFKSTNKEVAKVTKYGNVYAKGEGEAIIKVTCDNGKTYKCKVTVSAPVVKTNEKTLPELNYTTETSATNNGEIRYGFYKGQEITFGSYEQDNDFENGTEPIVWQVLESDGCGNYLVISKYVLDWQRYNDNMYQSGWENSSLRKWLNDNFYNNAFTKDEQKHIKLTHVKTNEKNYVTDKIIENRKRYIQSLAGCDSVYTNDYVFLMDHVEAYEKYYGRLNGNMYYHKEGLATITPYAYMNTDAIDDYILLRSSLAEYDLYSIGMDDDYIGGCPYFFRSYYEIENVVWDKVRDGYYNDEEHPYRYIPDYTDSAGVYATFDESVYELGLGIRPMMWVSVNEQE